MPGSGTLAWATALILGAGLGFIGAWFLARALGRFRQDRIVVQSIAERVRAVGKLVGLEVCAKEIATATSGFAWLPPILLSQARLAMIFNFEKQYSVDLGRVKPDDVQDLGEGRYRLRLPPLEGTMRLTDVTPYDIQSGRVLGLVDLIPMTADRQRDLMRRAQQQAAELYRSHDERYHLEARLSIERHLRALLELFGVRVEISWADAASSGDPAAGEGRRARIDAA
ncbi:MAG TPA: DUF4230 domain-containing protein [Phycisphaerales bacterium]|nr:DUF4230 domain-containing protein [Phycisphaerales bacterium]